MPDALFTQLRTVLRHDPLIAASRKIMRGAQSAHRFLATFPRMALLHPEDMETLATLVGAPLPHDVRAHWERCDMLHIGLDGMGQGAAPVRKLYLEFPPQDMPEPGLAYLAVKAGKTVSLHRYDMIDTPDALLSQLDLSAQTCAAARLLARQSCGLLQVGQAGSPRLSLDINLADTAPEPALFAALADLAAPFGAPPPRIWPSHVALGRSEDSAPFVTYYGWPQGPAP